MKLDDDNSPNPSVSSDNSIKMKKMKSARDEERVQQDAEEEG